MWIVRAYTWIKENVFIVGAAVGGLVTLILSLVLRGRDDTAETILKHTEESNANRKEKDVQAVAITEKFVQDVKRIRVQAEEAGETLTAEKEEVLVARLEAFTSAETAAEKQEIAEDIQDVFPFLGMVDPSEFGIVED